MPEAHKHNENKEGSETEVRVGDEMVTYRRLECSVCGKGMKNKIVRTRKLRDDEK